MKTITPGSFRERDSALFPEKVALIIPRSEFLSDEKVFMNLGILKVAAMLKLADITLDVIDLSGYQNFQEIIKFYVLQNPKVHCFGITSTTPQLPSAVKVAEAIRNARRDVRIILGGPHVTLVNTAFRRENKIGLNGRACRAMARLTETFDVVVAGDGEEAIFVAIQEKAPVIVDADQIGSELFLTDGYLTASPWPARELLDVESYHYSIDGERAISLIGQLGCPYPCGFCGGRESPTFRKIRTRTPEDIVAEMVYLHKTYGFNGFMMYDDELNVNTKMVHLMHLIAQAQMKLGVEWRLRGFIKSQLFTDEQAHVMYQAGFRWILVGFESGSSEILTAINKKATREENTRCMEIARRHGLKVKALISIGHPGESPVTIAETRSWLLEVKPDDFDVAVITCYPGTPYYDHALPHPTKDGQYVYTYKPTGARLYQHDVDFSTVAEYYKGDRDKGYHAYVYTDFLSEVDIVEARNRLEDDVRRTLGIPFNKSAVALLYEHSMGQGLPGNILRTTEG